MTDKANDILVDYEGLCGQLADILAMFELASQGYDEQTTSAIINTSFHALKYLIDEHNKITENYCKEQ